MANSFRYAAIITIIGFSISSYSRQNHDTPPISLSEFEAGTGNIPERGVTCVFDLPFNPQNWKVQYSCNGDAAKTLPIPRVQWSTEVLLSSAIDYFTRHQFKVESCMKESNGFTCILFNENMTR